MQKEDFKYFIENHDQLFDLYSNKYLVIKDKTIVCTGDSYEEAMDKAIEKGLEVGSFIVQLCTEGDEAYTLSFHSRVMFS